MGKGVDRKSLRKVRMALWTYGKPRSKSKGKKEKWDFPETTENKSETALSGHLGSQPQKLPPTISPPTLKDSFFSPISTPK